VRLDRAGGRLIWWTSLAIGLAAGPAAATPDDADAFRDSPLERDLTRLLPGRAEGGGFIFLYRPGGAADSGRNWLLERLGAAWPKVCARLHLESPKPLRVFVYETSLEMARLTGRPATEAVVFDDALHVALDRPIVAAGLARAAEARWGRAAERLAGGLEGGRWTRLRLAVRAEKLEVKVDDRVLSQVSVPAASGGIGFGVEEGRLGIRNLRLRPLGPDGTGTDHWSQPLRESPQAFQADAPGRFRIDAEELDGARYGRMTRIRLAEPAWKDLELECELRVSAGATAEVSLQVPPNAAGAAGTRVLFTPERGDRRALPGGVYVATGAEQGSRPVTGPFPTLREGLATAIGAEVDGIDLRLLARALLERGLAPARGLCALGFPQGPAERYRRQLLLGSFVARAIERFGVDKYRDLHFADLLQPKTPLGDLAELEADWRKWLKELPFSTDDIAAADRRLGLDLVASEQGWRDLARFATEGPGTSSARASGVLWTADAPGQSAKIAFPDPATRRSAVRAHFKLGEGSRLRLTIRTPEGPASAGVFATSGVALVAADATAVGRWGGFGLDAERWHDALVAFEDHGGRAYIDGELVADGKSGLAAGPGALAIELDGKSVEVKSAAVRDLER
jgi:hypothetical protein